VGSKPAYGDGDGPGIIWSLIILGRGIWQYSADS
jgi:hypothetical protein